MKISICSSTNIKMINLGGKWKCKSKKLSKVQVIQRVCWPVFFVDMTFRAEIVSSVVGYLLETMHTDESSVISRVAKMCVTLERISTINGSHGHCCSGHTHSGSHTQIIRDNINNNGSWRIEFKTMFLRQASVVKLVWNPAIGRAMHICPYCIFRK